MWQWREERVLNLGFWLGRGRRYMKKINFGARLITSPVFNKLWGSNEIFNFESLLYAKY